MTLIRTPVSLKVPARIAAIFWAIKLLTTAFGESTSDYLVHNVNPYLAVIGGFLVFLVAMVLQLADRPVRPMGLLARGLDGRCIRNDGRRRDAHRVPGAVRGLVDFVRCAAGRGLLDLVADRAHAVDSQHHDGPARALLLGCGPGHLRDGNGARRSRRVHVGPRLPLRRNSLRRAVRAPRRGLLLRCASTRSSRSGRPT